MLFRSKVDRFKRENQVNRGFIVKFERVDFLQSDIGLIQCAFGGLRCGGMRKKGFGRNGTSAKKLHDGVALFAKDFTVTFESKFEIF